MLECGNDSCSRNPNPRLRAHLRGREIRQEGRRRELIIPTGTVDIQLLLALALRSLAIYPGNPAARTLPVACPACSQDEQGVESSRPRTLLPDAQVWWEDAHPGLERGTRQQLV